MGLLRLAVLVLCFQLAHFTDPPCEMELECAECVPDNMPLVTSHRAANGSLTVPAGDELTLACGGGKFLAYPLRDTLTVQCEAGRYRVRADDTLRHLLDLGCQESIFEDVLHQVDNCGNLQGRAYLMRSAGAQPSRHLAALCFDADRAVAARLRMSNAPHNALRVAPHSDAAAPLSLLGNFNHMFDATTRHAAERLYSDDARMNRRLRELLKHEHYSFAEQSLTSAKLLSSHYFEDQNMRVTDFVSNRVAVWRSVAHGNLRHVQRDVAKFLALSRPHAELDVYAGTHGVLALRVGHDHTEIFLKAGQRFPVPKYIWTVVHAKQANKAVALVLLNDPFVSVSEIREAVFCESACGRVPWLHELRRQRRYETPLYGLVFCCSLRNFTSVVSEMPEQLINVPEGNAGMLTELFD
ncbi:hypothetical protein PYW07_013606 [Mythimna separata]|uniref:DNA/RNA non-specific endonuclease domain-containing protein n=1 Tax=Mythimna separata TaxID=271217 RepID=A0AAD7YEF9_MYTSE|nr:hypothetical protein PYW07_013606 [Mythimna separata]